MILDLLRIILILIYASNISFLLWPFPRKPKRNHKRNFGAKFLNKLRKNYEYPANHQPGPYAALAYISVVAPFYDFPVTGNKLNKISCAHFLHCGINNTHKPRRSSIKKTGNDHN